MSRLQIFTFLPIMLLMVTAAQSPDREQSEIDAKVSDIVARGKAKTTAIRDRCKRESVDEIVICGERDINTKYRQAEGFREKRTAIKGGVPDAPNVFGIPNHGPVVARGCFLGPCPKEPIVPYTADQLPVVDQEYLELARKAAEDERKRQAESQAQPE
ncbi:hypothetical protein [Sphingorhabdus sp. Alg239-R122]|uniref:hypothetical protein n=1 Tax=Sphingorhabdus sp. Alg239-R122 TaxID=2305989 RepID=UPI0013DA835B|nr:hypothetical protein [Sphingorhabdus sp. Alg239-R122]